jgi:hypothetical protein
MGQNARTSEDSAPGLCFGVAWDIYGVLSRHSITIRAVMCTLLLSVSVSLLCEVGCCNAEGRTGSGIELDQDARLR